jgi:hypothetical protein
MTKRAIKSKADPVYAAIEAHKASEKKWMAVSSIIDRKEHAARKKLGSRPFKSVLWRNYGVDLSDIKEKRDLYREQRVASPRVIKAEYLDTLERCRKQARKDDVWLRRAGVIKLRERLERGIAEEEAIADRLAQVKPTTPAGAAALIEYVSSDFAHSCAMDWQIQALTTIAKVLQVMEKRQAG